MVAGGRDRVVPNRRGARRSRESFRAAGSSFATRAVTCRCWRSPSRVSRGARSAGSANSRRVRAPADEVVEENAPTAIAATIAATKTIFKSLSAIQRTTSATATTAVSLRKSESVGCMAGFVTFFMAPQPTPETRSRFHPPFAKEGAWRNGCWSSEAGRWARASRSSPRRPGTTSRSSSRSPLRGNAAERSSSARRPAGDPSVLQGIAWTDAIPSRSDAALAIEAVPERFELKRDVFVALARCARAGRAARDEHVVALRRQNSPTACRIPSVSSACISSIRRRGCSWSRSFAPRRPATRRSSAPTTSSTRLGKTAVIAADTPGFIVNRVARPYYLQAMRALERGVASVEELDALARAAGFRMGPFELMDLIGLDVNLATTRVGLRAHASRALRTRRAAAQHGRARIARTQERRRILRLRQREAERFDVCGANRPTTNATRRSSSRSSASAASPTRSPNCVEQRYEHVAAHRERRAARRALARRDDRHRRRRRH